MDVVEMVLGATVNKEIVSNINRHGGNAHRRHRQGRRPDRSLAHVGHRAHAPDIERAGDHRHRPRRRGAPHQPRRARHVHRTATSSRSSRRSASTATGHSYNINADLVAGQDRRGAAGGEAHAADQRAGTAGRGRQACSPGWTRDEVDRLIDDGVIRGGMLPKIRCALDAVAAGVTSAHIIDGTRAARGAARDVHRRGRRAR